MIKPHIKVIQRNGVDIFVTSSMVGKAVSSATKRNALLALRKAHEGALNQAVYSPCAIGLGQGREEAWKWF